jgi:hypothetical protein
LSQTIGLNIPVIIFAGPNESTFTLNHIGDHIVDESVFVPDLLGFEIFFVLFVVDIFENILESAVIFLEDSILGAQIKRVFSLKSELETAVGKFSDAFIGVVHTETDTPTVVFKNLHCFLFTSVFRGEDDLEGSWSIDNEISATILVTESVSADNDRLCPAGN